MAALVLIGGVARVPRVGVHPRRPRPHWDTRRESRARMVGSRGARVRECSGAGAPPSGGGGSALELARLLGWRTALAPSWATAWALATWGSWAGAGWWCRVGFAEGLGRGKCCAAGPRKEAGGIGSGPAGLLERGGKVRLGQQKKGKEWREDEGFGPREEDFLFAKMIGRGKEKEWSPSKKGDFPTFDLEDFGIRPREDLDGTRRKI